MTQAAGPPDRRPSALQIIEAQRTLELVAAYGDDATEQLKLLESVSILKRINQHTGAFGHVKSAEIEVELEDGTLVYVHWKDGHIVEVTGVLRQLTHTEKERARAIAENLMAARTATSLEIESLHVADQVARIDLAIRRNAPGRKPLDAIREIERIIEDLRQWLRVPRRVR